MFHTLLCQRLSKHLFTIYVLACYTVVVNSPLQPESAGHHAGQRPACPSGGTKGPLLGRRWLVGHGAKVQNLRDVCQVHPVGLNTAVRKSCIILALSAGRSKYR